MGLSDLFANNLLVKLLRGDNSRYELIASMVGARLGDRVVVVGGGDGRLLAAVGAGTGLTGRSCAVEADVATAAAVNTTATANGVLVEVETAPLDRLPYDPASFDVAIATGSDDGGVAASLSEILRVLRPGGRCLVVARVTGKASDRPAEALRQAGFRAARLIAERSGLAFYEAVKSGQA
jgi:SAM-dependent methyltransferase